MRTAPLLLAFLLAACDPFGLPEGKTDTATYYVATGTVTGTTTQSANRIAIEYASPDGPVRDTLRGTQASWSKVFDRDDLASFTLTATNLTPPDTAGNAGFISASLLVNQKTVAFDSSRTSVSLSN